MNQRTSLTTVAVLLSSAFFSGCGKPEEEQARKEPETSILSSDNSQKVLSPEAEMVLTKKELETLALLLQVCTTIDLTKLDQISEPTKYQIASPEELSTRLILCSDFNASNDNGVETKQADTYRRLKAYLKEKPEFAGAISTITLLSECCEKIEKATDTTDSLREFEDLVMPLYIEKARLADKLANEYGILLTREKILIPVVGTISQPSLNGTFTANVVLEPRSHRQLSIAYTDAGGLIQISFEKIPETDLNIILANEFAHQFLIREGLNLEIKRAFLDSNSNRIEPAKPYLELKDAGLKSSYTGIKPTDPQHISELYSDSWSTKVNSEDVDRIISNSMFSIVRNRLLDEKHSFSPEVNDIINRTLPSLEGYSLSTQYTLFTILDLNKVNNTHYGESQMSSILEFCNELTNHFIELDKVWGTIDSALKDKEIDPKDLKELGELAKLQLSLCEGKSMELYSQTESFPNSVPIEYKLIIAKALEQYANDYIEQIKKISK